MIYIVSLLLLVGYWYGLSLFFTKAGKTSWPISGATFILLHKVPTNAANTQEVVKFFDWAFANGAAMATDLEYVPLPADTIKLIQASWKANLKDASGKALY